MAGDSLQFREEGDSSNTIYFEDVFNFKEFGENRPLIKASTHYELGSVQRSNFISTKKIKGKRTGRDGKYNYEDDMFKK